jgi:hypothetical protein
MLDPEEAASVEAAYGVRASQVQLDHMISHILGAIAGLDLPLTGSIEPIRCVARPGSVRLASARPARAALAHRRPEVRTE